MRKRAYRSAGLVCRYRRRVLGARGMGRRLFRRTSRGDDLSGVWTDVSKPGADGLCAYTGTGRRAGPRNRCGQCLLRTTRVNRILMAKRDRATREKNAARGKPFTRTSSTVLPRSHPTAPLHRHYHYDYYYYCNHRLSLILFSYPLQST